MCRIYEWEGVKIREVREIDGAKVEFGGHVGSVVGKEKVKGHGWCRRCVANRMCE